MMNTATLYSISGIIIISLLLQGCETPNSATEASTDPIPAPSDITLAITAANAIDNTLPPESREAVRVHHVDGVMLVTGQVLSEAEKASVSNAVAFSAGRQLRRLGNELRVVERIDLSTAENDAQLAREVEALLASSDPAPGMQIEAVVDAGRVFLLGRPSREQGEAAARLVSRMPGVTAVTTLFDYSD